MARTAGPSMVSWGEESYHPSVDRHRSFLGNDLDLRDTSMNSIDKHPPEGVSVIGYDANGNAAIVQYKRVLTWRGWKYLYVGARASHVHFKDLVGWNRFPTPEETLNWGE